MRKIKFLSFWLLLTVGMAIMVFNSCSKDHDDNSNNQNNSNNNSPTSDNGVVINGIKWATRNVDKPGTFAAKPEDPGMYYQWNSKVGWEYGYSALTPSDGTSTWNSSWEGNGATTWEKANDPCPTGWRMPSQDELISLYTSSGAWTTVNNVKGRRFGNGGNTIFLPAVGHRHFDEGELFYATLYGYYWSSTRHNSNHASNLFLDIVEVDPYDYDHMAFGKSCRCVESD